MLSRVPRGECRNPLGTRETAIYTGLITPPLSPLDGDASLSETFQCSFTGQAAKAMSDHDNIVVLDKPCASSPDNLDVSRPV